MQKCPTITCHCRDDAGFFELAYLTQICQHIRVPLSSSSHLFLCIYCVFFLSFVSLIGFSAAFVIHIHTVHQTVPFPLSSLHLCKPSLPVSFKALLVSGHVTYTAHRSVIDNPCCERRTALGVFIFGTLTVIMFYHYNHPIDPFFLHFFVGFSGNTFGSTNQ